MMCIRISFRAGLLFLIVLAIFTSGVHSRDYDAKDFGVTAQLPDDWSVAYSGYGFDSSFIVCFAMPSIWSDIEQTEIENIVSLTAYKASALKTIDDVVAFELDRVGDILVSQSDEAIEFGRAIKMITVTRGLHYHSLTAFKIENCIAYVLAFTATKGTYDKNLEPFLNFLSDLNFYPPEVTEVELKGSKYEQARQLYRGGSDNAPRIIALLVEELEEHPDNIEALSLLGRTYLNTDQLEKALDAFESSLSLIDGISPELIFDKARALHAMGRNEEAKELLDTYSAFAPDGGALEAQYNNLRDAVDKALSKE